MSNQGCVLIRIGSSEIATQLGEKLQGLAEQIVIVASSDDVKAKISEQNFDIIILCTPQSTIADAELVAFLKGMPNSASSALILVSAAKDDEELVRIKKRGGVRCFKIKDYSLQELLWVLIPLMPDATGPGIYDVRIINAFVNSVHRVFESYLGATPAFTRPEIKKSNKATGSFSTLMSFSGSNAQGSIALCFEKQFLVKLSRILFAGLTVPITDESLIDLAGEMGNQVCGSFKSNIAEHGLNVMISLPKVVSGSDHTVNHIVNNPVITITAVHDKNKLDVEFCMSKAQTADLKDTNRTDDMKSGEVALF